MNLINHDELKKQLASGDITSLDDITNSKVLFWAFAMLN